MKPTGESSSVFSRMVRTVMMIPILMSWAIKGASDAHAFSSVGIERLIPLRFILMKSHLSDPDHVTFETILRRVRDANTIFRPAGVQFYLKSIERYAMPSFADISDSANGDRVQKWKNVRAELQQVLPIPSHYWPDTKEALETHWLRYAAIHHAPDTELIVWVAQAASSSRGDPPWTGRSIQTSDMTPGPGWINTYTFSHELGHFLGLPHTFNGGGAAMIDYKNPETGSPIRLSEFWDLVYKPAPSGQPDLFFNSRSEAAAHEADLIPLDQDLRIGIDNCTMDNDGKYPASNGTVTCVTASSTYQTGHPGMKGMGIRFSGDAPPAVYNRGVNVMAYITGSHHGAGISNSQILQIRRALRYDAPIEGEDHGGKSGRRPFLGHSAYREPNYRLDFDGDGLRDIAVWQPPIDGSGTGRFTALLSSKKYSAAAPLEASLGKLGDVPVPADYDGDGKTDFAVFSPGSATSAKAYWRYCASGGNPQCTSALVPSIPWGDRGDIPLPGTDFDGDPSTGELAIFRPSIGRFGWRFIQNGRANYRDLGGPGKTPLPGLYDLDSRTDLVVYSPANVIFEMLLSGSTWNTKVTRAFPAKLIPSQSGTPQQRASAVPVPVMRQIPKFVPGNDRPTVLTRRVLSLWDPQGPPGGTWVTMWDPVSSSTISKCDWGSPSDTPLGGFIDRDFNSYGDMIVYRSPHDNVGGQFHIRSSSRTTCAAASKSFYLSNGKPRSIVFVSSDLTGDGRDELALLDPETMVWYFFRSEDDYRVVTSFQLGSHSAVPL